MAKHYKTTKKTLKNKIIYLIFLIIFMISIFYIIDFIRTKHQSEEQTHLLENIKVDTSDITPEKSERMLQVEELKQQNEDVVGWIEIENTSINYPVLQGEDNDYYMNHNYKKEEQKGGSIFLDKDYDWSIPSSNLLIYGHNLNNGTMFEELLKYENQEYYTEHPIIRFTTIEEDAKYEIISVFKSRVYYKSEKNVFRYYFFINAENEQEYNEYVQNAKAASL